VIREPTIYAALFLAILAFLIPRKYFLLPYVLAACFVPSDQRIIIMDLDFTVLRILIVAGVLRILVRGEYTDIKLNKFDQMLLVWVVCGAVVYIIRNMSTDAIVYKTGVLFDAIGLYWLFRQTVRSWDDIKLVAKFFALSALVLVPFVALEWSTGQNPFVILGKVVTKVRVGQFRCQAAFPHSIMLGLFWATLVPIFIGLAGAERQKYLYWAATCASVFIIFGTASSTPLATLLCVLLLTAVFRYRFYGRQIVYSLCGLIIILHIIMNHPVWHIMARVNIIGGSTGYHRYLLIDRAITRFDEWALLGTQSTSHWGLGLGDITNQYILEGARGGLITLVFFMVLLIMAVKTVGRYSLRSMPIKQQWLAWCLCVSILGHCLSFMGVSYFGQIMMLLYLTLAIVGLIYEISLNASRYPVQLY